jgi:hypothetical protein
METGSVDYGPKSGRIQVIALGIVFGISDHILQNPKMSIRTL